MTRFCLDRWLKVARLSQTEISRRSGISPTTVNRMANNLNGQVHLHTLAALAGVLSQVIGQHVAPGDLIESDA